jgi:murein L,D-transpeptidase YafK
MSLSMVRYWNIDIRPFVILVLISLSFINSSAVFAGDIELLVDRSDRALYVIKDGRTLRSFHVALGSTRKAKERSGDRATPTGTYYIKVIRDSSTFYKFIQIDYPNMADAKRGLLDGIITRKQYRQILNAHVKGRLPPQNTQLGGSIGIHGIGTETQEKLEIHAISDWTKGCIAMRNKDVKQLVRFIKKDTQIRIVD